MQQQIQCCQFEAARVRVVNTDGVPWFVARDVCAVLGIVNGRDAVARLDPDETSATDLDTLGGLQTVRTVNESGLYSLIMTSRKPEARAFKRWVTHEVLPSIARTGAYAVQPAHAIPQTLSEALRLAADLADQRDKATQQLALAAPKVAALERIAESTGSKCVTDAAKALGVGPQFLFAWLSDHGWIYRRPASSRREWVAFQTRIKDGHLEHKVNTVEASDGDRMVERVLVTPKGLALLAQRVKQPAKAPKAAKREEVLE